MFKEKTGKCEDCKHIVALEDMQKVESSGGNLWYCPEHKKPYVRKEYRKNHLFGGYSFYEPSTKPRYFIKCDWLEVDENGVPVHYIKKSKEEPEKRKYNKTGKYSKKTK